MPKLWTYDNAEAKTADSYHWPKVLMCSQTYQYTVTTVRKEIKKEGRKERKHGGYIET